jgi:hypothetical protein
MKVLEEGKWKKPWSAEVSCSEKECEAKLLVDESDVKAVDYSSPASYSVMCPVCKSKVVLSSSSVPKWVKCEADKKKMVSSGGSYFD